ncbi:MAG: hypothetical protein L3J71_02475 [Victivallaceae bacterium]|nr:hypothetical protein [Victivallaceae bacterium]
MKKYYGIVNAEANPKKYDGLILSDAARQLLTGNPVKFKSYCNGVGSPGTGWLSRLIYKLTPNTIWGMNITDCSDVHDVDYTIPSEFPRLIDAINHKRQADFRFFENLTTRITGRGGFFEDLRHRRASKYYYALSHFARANFLKNKTILNKD